MDGLMLNTEDMYLEICSTLLSRRGKTFQNQLRRKMMGQPAPQAWNIMIQMEGLRENWQELQAEAETLAQAWLALHLRPMPGLHGLLDRLDACSLPRCVATSSRKEHAISMLESTHLLHRVDFIVTAEDVRVGKPAPDIYLLAAKQMGILVENMLVLEDSQNGAAAGVAANAQVIAVPSRHSFDHQFADSVIKIARLDDSRLLKSLNRPS